MSKLSTTLPLKAVLNVTVGDSVAGSLARARSAMETLQRGKTPQPHFGVGFAQVGQMLSVFTPKRWELIATLRESGPLTTADLARKLRRDYKNVHADVTALAGWLAVERMEDGRVQVPWSEIVVDLKLPSRLAA
jgi:predicted transcriptional regulator